MSSHDFRDWNNLVAAVLILANSFIGLSFHFLIIHSFIKDSKQRTSFNVICFFRAINNVFVLGFAFLGVFLPTIVLGHSLYNPFVETILIVIALNCNLFHSYQGIYFALNRFFSIFFPIKYYLFFKVKYNIVFHFLIYGYQAYSIYRELIHRHDTRAYLLFSAPQLAYVGLLRASNEVYIFAAFFVGIPSVLNIFTFLRYHQLKRSSTRNSEKFEEAKRNMIRFLQTVLQDSLFSINVVFNTGIYTLIDHRLWSFFCHTFIWQSLNVLDGLVMFVFNEELSPVRNVIFSKVGPTNLQNIVSERVTTT